MDLAVLGAESVLTCSKTRAGMESRGHFSYTPALCGVQVCRDGRGRGSCRRWPERQNPEHLEFGFRGMFSVVSVPSRGVGELRIETDSSARKMDRPHWTIVLMALGVPEGHHPFFPDPG